MKTLVETYTFTPSTRRVTFTSLNNINLDQILLITNVTTGTIIYNFAKPELGAVKATSNSITLDYNTTSMSGTDRLQIFIDIPDVPKTTTFQTPASAFLLPTNTRVIYRVYGNSFLSQDSFLQIRYYSSFLASSTPLYTKPLKPYETFDINFERGLRVPGLLASAIVNSLTPTLINLNNNNSKNLLVNVDYSEYT